MSMESDLGFGSTHRSQLVATGLLIMDVVSPKYADITIKDLETKMYTIDSIGDTTIQFTVKNQEMVIRNIKEDGTIDGEISEGVKTFAGILFPALGSKINIGDSIDLPILVPFNLYGNTIKVNGKNKLKYLSKVGNIEKLETQINANYDSIGIAVNPKYSCYMNGYSNFTFNSRRRIFTEGEININLGFRIYFKDERTIRNENTNMSTKIILNLINVK